MNHFKVLNSNRDCLRKIKSIYFDFKSFALDDKAKADLRKNADCLSKNPRIFVTLVGHSDDKEIKQFKADLSAKRAGAVKDYLVKLGLNEKRFQILHANYRSGLRSDRKRFPEKLRRVDFLIRRPVVDCVNRDEECLPNEETICISRDDPCRVGDHCRTSEIDCNGEDIDCFREPPPTCTKCETGEIEECEKDDKECLLDDQDCHDDIPCNSEDHDGCPGEGGSCLLEEKPSCGKSEVCKFDVDICLLEREDCGSKEREGGGGQHS